MQKIVLTFGAIAGAIILVLMFLNTKLWIGEDGKMDFDKGQLYGYISMIVSLSMIFFGVRSFRDNQLGGVITFGNALKTGLLIALVASAIYVVGWIIYYYSSDDATSFMQKYIDFTLEKMKAAGKSQAEIDEAKTSLESMAKNFENPLVRIGMTFMEIFPVGLVISLISAALLRKTQAQPA